MLHIIEQDWFFFGLMFAGLLLCLVFDGSRLWRFRHQIPYLTPFFFGVGGLIIFVYILILLFSSNGWTNWLLLPVVVAFIGGPES